jgi:hypothetical protein
MGIITVPMFPPDVNSLDHPEVANLRAVYEGMARAYQCKMTSFAIDHGVIFVSFDSEELCNDIMVDMKEISLDTERPPTGELRKIDEAVSMVKKARKDFEQRN